MPQPTPESKAWMESLSDLAADIEKHQKVKHADRADALDLHPTKLSFLLALHRCLDPAALAKIRQAAQGDHPFTLSFKSAKALAELEGRVPDLSKAVHEALDQILPHHLATLQIKALVDHMASGKPAQEFDPTQVKKTPKGGLSLQSPSPDPPQEAEEDSEDEEPEEEPTNPKAKKKTSALRFQTEGQGLSVPIPKKGMGKAKGPNLKPAKKALKGGFKDLLKYIHEYVKAGSKAVADYFIPLHSRSSGKRGGAQSLPNLFRFAGHWGLYWFCVLFMYGGSISFVGHFIPGVGPWIDGLRLAFFHFILHLPLWLLAQALAKPWVVLVLGVALVWWIHKEFHAGLMATLIVAAVLGAGWYFRGWVMEHLPNLTNPFSPPSLQDTKNDQALDNSKTQSPITSPPKAAGSPMEPAQPSHGPRPVVSAQAPSARRSQTDGRDLSAPIPEKGIGVQAMPKEDRASLEAEIAALPRPCRVKDFPIEPDPNIGAEMAGRRLSDIQDPEKYSLRVGPDEKKITSAVVNGSGFNMEIQGGFSLGDINSVLGDSSKKGMAFYWEDVRAIHCCEVDVLGDHPRTLYQCGLLIAGLKKPITVQCASVEDLGHLVSGLEFWVRNAQGGKNAPIGGLPYLYQGLLLGSEGEVIGTWDNSPIAKTGFMPGDHIWSVDSNPGMRMGNEELLSSLQDLSPGPHALFVVDPGEWVKGMTGPRNRTWVFNPKRVKLQLLVQ